MEKEFIPYEQALALKELGFDEPCFGAWVNRELFIPERERPTIQSLSVSQCTGPLYQQAFRWFKEKYQIKVEPLMYIGDKTTYRIHNSDYNTPMFYTPEEAELECLKKLIEIVKNK